jgi:tRNA(fMet)-specific endonuclease VapC
VILDSSFLIDLLRTKDGDAEKKANELDQKLVVKATTSISVLELWRGVLRAHSASERQKVNSLLGSVQLYPFNEEAAKKAAVIEADLMERGEMIDLEDIMIAGITLSKNETILTKNVKHFGKIKGLDVETY